MYKVILLFSLFMGSVSAFAEDPKSWELNGGTNLNLSTQSHDISSGTTLSVHVVVGKMLGDHWEAMIQPDYSFSSLDSIHDITFRKYNISSHIISIMPGMAYNFSKDTQNSLVVQAFAGIRMAYIDNGLLNVYDSPSAPSFKPSLYSTFGWSVGAGKRFALGSNVSFYPLVEYNASADTKVFSNSFVIYPVNFSIWI